jgi:hypothetical protein
MEGMQAKQGLVEAFVCLGDQLNKLNTAIGSLECSQLIKLFEGNPREFKDWVKSIEKCAFLTQTPNDKVGLLAFRSSRGQYRISYKEDTYQIRRWMNSGGKR